MKKKVSTKKSEIKVNPRVSDCYEETEGFTGQATSHRGVVIRKGKGGFEAPRFGLENYRSLGAIKSAIDKSMSGKISGIISAMMPGSMSLKMSGLMSGIMSGQMSRIMSEIMSRIMLGKMSRIISGAMS